MTGEILERSGLVSRLIIENTRSDGAELAGMVRYLAASLLSLGQSLWRYFHQESKSVSTLETKLL